MPALIELITLSFSLSGFTGGPQITLASDATVLHSQGSELGSELDMHIVLDSASSASLSKSRPLMRREKRQPLRKRLLTRRFEAGLSVAISQQVMVEQRERYVRREGKPFPQLVPAIESMPAADWWDGAGPVPDTGKRSRSRTVVVVFISNGRGEQFTAGEWGAGPVFLTESSGSQCIWNLVYAGQRGRAFIQRASGDGSEYLCDDGYDGVTTSPMKCPWLLMPTDDGHISVRSSLTKMFIDATGPKPTMVSTCGDTCKLKITVISVGWGRHRDANLVSPTSLEVLLATDDGDLLRNDGSQVAFIQTQESQKGVHASETWNMIDAGHGWSYLRNVNSKQYLTDESGVLKLTDWAGNRAMDDAKKWWLIGMHTNSLPKNMLRSLRRDQVKDVDGVPKSTVKSARNDRKSWVQPATDDWAGTKRFQLILKDIKFQLDV